MRRAAAACGALGLGLIFSQITREFPAVAVILVGIGLVICAAALYADSQEKVELVDDLAERRARREALREDQRRREEAGGDERDSDAP